MESHSHWGWLIISVSRQETNERLIFLTLRREMMFLYCVFFFCLLIQVDVTREINALLVDKDTLRRHFVWYVVVTDGAKASWGSALIIAYVGKCAESLVGAALLPARWQAKKIKGVCVCVCACVHGGEVLLIERECLRLWRSSKDILDKLGKESITGCWTAERQDFIDKLTSSHSGGTCSYYAMKNSDPHLVGFHPPLAFDDC